MKPNQLKAAMIRTAVKKGIRDIKDEPKRGARNLVELGEMFSTGTYQQNFFTMAMNHLNDESSAYYQIVNRVVQTMNEETLLTFGINLGYNALIHGGGMIRCIEQREGFNVPWCLQIELGDEAGIPPLDINAIIEQGMELGIYCYLFFIDKEYTHIDELLQIIHSQNDCAFLLFLHPSMITNAFCDAFFELHNALPVLDIDAVDEDELTHAINLLSNVNCLSSGFTRQADFTTGVQASETLEYAEVIDLHILVFVRTKKHRPSNEDDVYRQLVKLRENLDVPVLPIDLFGDLAHADRVISTEACLASIKKDGTFTLLNMEQNVLMSGYNIREQSLQEILEHAMPKRKNTSI